MSLPRANTIRDEETWSTWPLDELEPVMGELVDDPFDVVRVGTPERHDNRVYLPPIELCSGPRRRIEARICQIYRHDTGQYHHTRLELIYFKRRHNVDKFVVDRKAALDGAALEALVAALLQIPKLQSLSLEQASRTLLLPVDEATGVLPAAELRTLTEEIGRLLSAPQGIDAIRNGHLTLDALSNIEAAAQHARFKQAAAELQGMMVDQTKPEREYQQWFEAHPWVFGTEYVRRVPARMIDLRSQADILLVSVDGFVDVLELKKPSEVPLLFDSSHDTYYPSAELSKSLAQAMHYLRVINENRRALIEDWGELVFRPRAIIVVGRSHEWSEPQKRGWRNLRTSLQNIDVLTFDHVLARAEQLIAQYEAAANEVNDQPMIS